MTLYNGHIDISFVYWSLCYTQIYFIYTVLYILFASILLRMFRMKMTTIYPSIATPTATARPTATAAATATATASPAITTAYTTPILAIHRNPVLFGSIFQKINSNGPCSSCGNSK